MFPATPLTVRLELSDSVIVKITVSDDSTSESSTGVIVKEPIVCPAGIITVVELKVTWSESDAIDKTLSISKLRSGKVLEKSKKGRKRFRSISSIS